MNSGCKKFLDVVPDGVATIDYAFRQRSTAEQYLFTCYSYMPKHGNPFTNPAFGAGDEFWYFYPYKDLSGYPLNQASWEIARGTQSVSAPLTSYWTGSNGATNLFKGIRDCNIFLENIRQVQDMDDYEKDWWASEASFLKAYYHWWLLRMYGPIPIIDKNLPIDASQQEVQVERMPVDSCVHYIVNTLDSTMINLPDYIQDQTTQMGRITKAIALAVKAQVLVTAASPLFNGNITYTSFRNKAGQPFFNQTYDAQKWVKATEACKAAIDFSHSNGNTLNKFTLVGSTLPAELQVGMDVRTAVTDNFNEEVIWGNTNSMATDIQSLSQPRPNATNGLNVSFYGMASVPLHITNLFYTKNGVPITEDKTFDFGIRGASTRVSTDADKYYIQPSYTTAAINFDREPRFYADLGFDGSILYGNGNVTVTALNHLEAKQGQYSGWQGTPNNYNATGYWSVKLLNYQNTMPSATTYIIVPYAWPTIRLADLYLLYAEALNEANGPGGEVYDYINKVRTRAGIPSVQDAWSNYSNNPSKYTTKEGLREIIHRERNIELAFEGQRFWDLLRWKEAERVLQVPIQGWNYSKSDVPGYYQINNLFNRSFQVRDYFWPIAETDLLTNKNLVQNPGW